MPVGGFVAREHDSQIFPAKRATKSARQAMTTPPQSDKHLDEQWAFTAPFEGVVRHMYLDTAGYVTVGVGFMLPTEAAVRQYTWMPSTVAALTDYRRVKVAEKGHRAAYYAPMCGAWMSDAVMRAIFRLRVSELRQAMSLEWQLELLPAPVQLALVDMAYNLGLGRLSRYVQLSAAVRARDWQTAAAECHRRGIGDKRNAATQALFAKAEP